MKKVMEGRFPAGEYVVYGEADFFIEEDGEEKNYRLKAQVRFVVEDY
ncbi:hypothetical protein [Paenibacillus sambharensis]|nr:hypothetical protein [Paenibacillus sambharensis]